MNNNYLLPVLSHQKSGTPPIWLMRQAGRYLPEYRELRKQAKNFLDFCYRPELAIEATLQPLRRFELDAAIIFSDILVIPDALGMKVDFQENIGPVLEQIKSEEDIAALSFNQELLNPVYEALSAVRAEMDDSKTLIGFAGAPWTILTYMLEGRTSKQFIHAKKWCYGNEKAFLELLNIVTDAVTKHLKAQIKAGADIVKIFDSWSGVLTKEQFKRYSYEPMMKILREVKKDFPDTPIILFPKGAGSYLSLFNDMPKDCAIAFDQFMDPHEAKSLMPGILQGNIDPLMLCYDSKKTCERANALMDLFQDRPFILNLGHGVIPQTPPEHVEKLVNTVMKRR